jgi:hypothetical protein
VVSVSDETPIVNIRENLRINSRPWITFPEFRSEKLAIVSRETKTASYPSAVVARHTSPQERAIVYPKCLAAESRKQMYQKRCDAIHAPSAL